MSGLNTNSFVELPTLTTHTPIPPATGMVVPTAVDVALSPRPCRVNDVVAPTASCPATDSVIVGGRAVAGVAPVATKPLVLEEVAGSTAIVPFIVPWAPATDSVIAGGGRLAVARPLATSCARTLVPIRRIEVERRVGSCIVMAVVKANEGNEWY